MLKNERDSGWAMVREARRCVSHWMRIALEGASLSGADWNRPVAWIGILRRFQGFAQAEPMWAR